MKYKKTYFGSLSNGQKASLYTVSNNQISFTASDYGCALISLIVPAKNQEKKDVVLGLPTLSAYSTTWGSFGSIIGRFSNRINGAKFTLDGKEYNLIQNIEGACLHGGWPRWENEIWKASFIKGRKKCGIKFSKQFPDGYQGFPGNLSVQALYILEENRLSFIFKAKTDKRTPVSITNHTYFNLTGDFSDIREEKLLLNCKEYLESDSKNNVSGKILPVDGTVYDFTRGKIISENFPEKGYDNSFVTQAYNPESGLPSKNTPLADIGSLTDFKSKIKMEVKSNLECLQLYTANYVRGVFGKSGAVYRPFTAVCLETQAFPDSPNQASFPSVILNPGHELFERTDFIFSVIQ